MSSYRQADGTFTSGGKVLAGGASSSTDAAAAVAAAWLRTGEKVIPPQFAVGTAPHESGYAVNIRDIESTGHTTGGVFELDIATLSPFIVGDAIAAGMPEKDVFNLDDACSIFAARCRYYLARIVSAANAYESSNSTGMTWPDAPPAGSQIWAYVAIAHNQGLGSASSGKGALGTIARYGVDWAGYKSRNPTVNIAVDRGSGIYGDDVITGGPDWSEGLANPFDASGAAIDVPTVDAFTSSRIRLALVLTLLALVAYYFAINKTPLKGTL